MRAFVTGHMGYIGRHLLASLSAKGHAVMGADLKDGLDLCDGVPKVIDHFKADVIFHLAAIPRVAYSVENPLHVMKNNIVSTSVVLDYARKNDIPVIYSSSSFKAGWGS